MEHWPRPVTIYNREKVEGLIESKSQSTECFPAAGRGSTQGYIIEISQDGLRNRGI